MLYKLLKSTKKNRVRFLILTLSLGMPMAITGCSGGTAQSVSPSPTPVVQSTSSPEASAPAEELKLVWSDEFDGENGSSVSKDNWVIETGNNKGWGNNELQYYTDSPENLSIQDGNLVIKAIKEDKEDFHYTSARIKTHDKFDFTYGKIEMRAKLPQGKGIWPAFWMLGSDIDTNPWPKCGEIDIMEFIGRRPNIIFGTLHGPEYNGSMGLQNFITFDGDLHDTYHTYALEWDESSLKWYFDGELFHQIYKDKLPKTYTWVYDKDFFILVNLAVGGNWPQNPNDSTVFPQSYTIDYIRVYQK